MHTTSLNLLCVIVLGIASLAQPVALQAASAPTADIPGIPLDGTTVTSEVGGPIVDVVYELNVPAASSVLISVTGEAGAELGLYLFSSAAKSILSDQPLLVAAKPGNYQSLVAQFVRGSNIYININGRNTEKAYGFTLTVAILVDKTPPNIVFLDSPRVSSSRNFCVIVDAVDRGSRVAKVAVAGVSSQSPLDWQPYFGPGRYCFSVEAGDGPREFVVVVMNGVGLTSPSLSFKTRIDDQSPSVTAVAPARAVLLLAREAVTWEFNESVLIKGSADKAIVVIDQSGSRVAGRATIAAGGRTVTWRPSLAVPPGSILMCSVVGVVDRAGNPATLTGAAVIIRKSQTASVIQRVWRKGVLMKAEATVSSNLVGKLLVIQLLVDGIWIKTGTVRASARNFIFKVPQSSAQYVRLSWEGSERLDISKSERYLLPN